jgi:long-subunit acyl-CoA synthetase (AMP-forming)
MARGLEIGEVGSASGLRQLVSKVAVTSYALLNVVGDKLVWFKVKAGFGGKLRRIITGGMHFFQGHRPVGSTRFAVW